MKDNEKFPLRFFTVTFLWSWLIWLPLVLAGFGVISLSRESLKSITIPVMVLAAFGPAVGAFYSLRTLNGKGSIRVYLKSFFSLKFGWKVWIAIFSILGISTAISWFIPELFGADRLGMLLPNIYIFPIYWLVMVFFGGGQEEIGWRGYALPFLEKQYGRWFGSIILAVLWACWHLPLWFIPGTSQTYVNFAGFIMLTLGYSFFYSWIMKASGKKPLAGLIVHGTANAFVPVFPVLVMTLGVAQVRFWIWVSLTLLIGIVVMILSEAKFGKQENRIGT
ncbi:MAG: CPBP family intramembrane metalloprotease [Spirochaetes bacterium]|nr:MAG: CPBP family intramembrane metalloprotease [Spirochaetota bacterium]